MTHEQQDDGQALPSSIRSAISMLKGRKANDNPPSTSASEDMPAAQPVLTVMPEPLADKDLFPITSNLPEGQTRQKMLEFAAQNKTLTYALDAANVTIDGLEKELAQAKEMIARLSLERTEGVEDIIDRLRQFQVAGANLSGSSSAMSKLDGIFSISTKLTQRAELTSFNIKLEDNLRLALETLQAASGNAFSFDMDSTERRDFWVRPVGASGKADANPDMPAKLLLVDLKKSANSGGNTNDVKIVVIGVKDKISFLNESEFQDKYDRKSGFLNSLGTYSGGIFRWNGQKVEYEGSGSTQHLKGPFDTIPRFIDELVGSCLTDVMGSTGFDQTARTLKAMGLVP